MTIMSVQCIGFLNVSTASCRNVIHLAPSWSEPGYTGGSLPMSVANFHVVILANPRHLYLTVYDLSL